MVDEHDDQQAMNTREQVRLRKLQAAMYAQQTKLFLRKLYKPVEMRLNESPDPRLRSFGVVPGSALTFAELREAVLAFLHREETVESFNRAIDFAEKTATYRMAVGSSLVIEIPCHPQLSESFVAAFATYIAVDAKVLYCNILKDLLAYQSYLVEMAGGDDSDKPRRRRGFAEAGGD